MRYDSYASRNEAMLEKRLVGTLGNLPSVCSEYLYNNKNMKCSTRLAYARDLSIFFYFLKQNYPDIFRLSGIVLLQNITSDIYTEYRMFLHEYEINGKCVINSEDAINRKLLVFSNMYYFYYSQGLLETYPEWLVKKKKKAGTLKAQHADAKRILDQAIENVYSRQNLSGKQLEYTDKTRLRDIAIIRLLCDTGISLSQCVALNIEDVNYKNNSIVIYENDGWFRLPLDNQTAKSLKVYIEKRKNIRNLSNDGNALFLSMQKRRMSGRAIEKMIKKYCSDDCKPMDFRNSKRIVDMEKAQVVEN